LGCCRSARSSRASRLARLPFADCPEPAWQAMSRNKSLEPAEAGFVAKRSEALQARF